MGYTYAKSRTMSRYAGWLPSRPEVYRDFMRSATRPGIVTRGRTTAGGIEHEPAVATFEKAINADLEMRSLFDQIFLQVAKVSKVDAIKDFNGLLTAIDRVIVSAPKFHISKDENGEEIGEPIGVPIYLLFDLLANTSAGYDLFRKPAFNAAIKGLIDSWGQYLTTPSSNHTLDDTDEGWFGPAGLASLEAQSGVFDITYEIPDPEEVNKGYTSWDHFFTRKFQNPQVRPVDFPEDKSLLHSACESTVYNISHKVKKHDKFWLKSQSYSLYDMFDRNDEDADKFVGGTVYQAFLSPQDYHRWHSPADGVVKKTVNVPGTYYAALTDGGADESDPDLLPGDPHGALVRSQAWLTLSAARALVFIEADNPDLGLFCFIGVGMGEVSTCEITVEEGDRVQTGGEIGMFHFGGSSHALVFGPQTNLEFEEVVQLDQHIWVNSTIARISRT